jgi:PilZ domain
MQTRPMTERRATPRHNVFRAGTIEFEGGAAHCKIQNISRMGAALELSSSAIVPHELDLIMVDGRVSQHCYVVWRREKRIGVRFDCSSPLHVSPAPCGR